MHFIYDNDVYALDFSRNRVIVKAHERDGEFVERLSKYPHTTVNVLKLDPKEKGIKNAEVILSETVGCFHKDTYSPERGRIQALKALTVNQRGRIPENMLPLIWSAYHHRNLPDYPIPTGESTPAPIVPEADMVPSEKATAIQTILEGELVSQ